MNCQQFQIITTELAREQMMDAATRESALEHAVECVSCARSLDDHRSLGKGLYALALASSWDRAPSRVEDSLRAAFRQQARSVSVLRRAKPWMDWRGWVAAAAAVLFVLFSYGVVRMMRNQAAPEPKTAVKTPDKPNSPQNSPDPKESPREVAFPNEDEPAPAPDNYRNRNAPKYRVPRDLFAKTDPQRGSNSMVGNDYASDFIPVSYGASLPPLESGRIIRVEMPRSVLAALGIPVNRDRMDERVKADVLLGDDGLTRAIRFVQ
jgi:hypothetical protein